MTHEFSTGNKNIKGKIVHSYTRNATSYTVTCNVYLWRTNNWKGKATTGTLHYTPYVNGVALSEVEKSMFVVKNGGTECLLGSWSKTFDLGVFSTGSYTVGFSCRKNSSSTPDAYSIAKTTSGAVSVGAYASPNGASTVTVANLGNNYFRIYGKVGNKGSGNSVSGCTVYYTTNDTTPSPTNYSGSQNFSLGEGSDYKMDVIVTSKTKVRAVVYTNGSYNTTEYGEPSSEASATVPYYATPTMSSVSLSCTPTRPTKRSTYTASWTANKANDDSEIKGYNYTVYIGTTNIYSSSTTATSLNVTSVLSSLCRTLKKGDELKVSVSAYTTDGNGTTLSSTSKTSNSKTSSINGEIVFSCNISEP